MLQETQRRLVGLDCGPAIVVCNAEHRFMVAEQLRGETAENPAIILEPDGRNTAPAIALAALQAQELVQATARPYRSSCRCPRHRNCPDSH